jgi:hypothetical protein
MDVGFASNTGLLQIKLPENSDACTCVFLIVDIVGCPPTCCVTIHPGDNRQQKQFPISSVLLDLLGFFDFC